LLSTLSPSPSLISTPPPPLPIPISLSSYYLSPSLLSANVSPLSCQPLSPRLLPRDPYLARECSLEWKRLYRHSSSREWSEGWHDTAEVSMTFASGPRADSGESRSLSQGHPLTSISKSPAGTASTLHLMAFSSSPYFSIGINKVVISKTLQRVDKDMCITNNI
jgi:hypothetical protein